MRVRLLLFGIIKDLLSDQPREIDLPSGSTVADLLAACRAVASASNTVAGRSPVSGSFIDDRMWSSLAVAVNREYVSPLHTLSDGDEVALLPPVSGGAPDPEDHVSSHSDFASTPGANPGANIVRLVREPIDAASVVAALKQGEDGAVVVFDGIVRNNTRGRRTLYLDYESYDEMALRQMQQLAAQSIADFKIRQVAIVHRLGRLDIGETSVLIAVASAHRAAAFDACRWLIDTLKKTVPIWKKEHFEDGAIWAAGEPFPPEIVAHSERKP
jgi:molybdopterin synthase catalytic subunit